VRDTDRDPPRRIAAKRLTHAIIIVDGKLPAIAGSLRRSPTRIDRLARSIGDLQDIVRAVRARGASPKATEQPIDTRTAAGKCFLDMLGVFAEFETDLRRERQLGDRQGQSRGRLQGPAGFNRYRPGARDEGRGQRCVGGREGTQDRLASVYRVLEAG